ncbi:MAG: hypothetical protein PUI53_08850 [Butyricicoccus porcorum]|nr:hypothetical protein [Butyricicoccus porcorum]
MKKRMFSLLSVTALAALLLAGCGTATIGTNQQNATTSSTVTGAQTTDGSAAGTAQNNTTAQTGTAQANTAETADISALSKKVSEAVAAADAAKPSGTTDADRTLFMEHKTALDALDREVDAYSDALEAQYRNGSLRYEDFRSKDAETEKLEDSLDDAEDRLEDRFGMDD